MPAHVDHKNTRSGSTTWRWETPKIRAGSAPQASRAAGASRWWHLKRRDSKQRLTITVKYRGGSEAWYHIEARGSGGAFPGVTSLHDVLQEINEGDRFRRRD